ncbi:MAG: hypothetical protein ACRES4_03040 [Nevskiales bacterium]
MSLLSMYQRISWPGWLEMYRRELPQPVEVLNLIDYGDREQFLWYGLFVVPTIYGLGGGVQWSGEWQASLLGERQAEALLLVRYPSHRRFMLMVTNPYYALINLFRQNGEAHFEASFTQPEGDPQVLRRERQLLVAHCDDEAQATSIKQLLAKAGAEKVYAVHEVAAFDFFREYSPSDPNPLRMKRALFFRPGPLSEGLTDALGLKLQSQAPGLSLQIYRRQSRKAMLPQPLSRLFN